MNTENIYGIEYTKPKVYLLKDSGLAQCEIGARICYDSLELSENEIISSFNDDIEGNIESLSISDIDGSDLLNSLAHVHFHHSVLEHTNLTFLLKGISRGVLQELVRSRIASYSVRSTRYTMSGIINAFVASKFADKKGIVAFFEIVNTFDMFVTSNEDYNRTEIDGIYEKLSYQFNVLGKDEFFKIAVAKSSQQFLTFDNDYLTIFDNLQSGKKKRNVGDAFKHIVSDNWKVDMVVTMNIRALKNYFDLRDSGAAFFQIRWLAQEMKKVTPSKYLKLIDKNFKDI
jgi:thymidylate synthase (FAD)